MRFLQGCCIYLKISKIIAKNKKVALIHKVKSQFTTPFITQNESEQIRTNPFSFNFMIFTACNHILSL
ncbi:MAG: hypothetical protein BJG00_006080 [Limnothrix sp. CACIAM 69d]|nr:MAG: hypothetical protein BJG00_006080 [Limnothrix sp. CACIAM 69d]